MIYTYEILLNFKAARNLYILGNEAMNFYSKKVLILNIYFPFNNRLEL